MARTLGIMLAVGLAAAIVAQGLAPAEAQNKRATNSSPNAGGIANFSELQGISSSVDPVETGSRPRKSRARRSTTARQKFHPPPGRR